MKEPICELYHDNFQNYKSYGICSGEKRGGTR